MSENGSQLDNRILQFISQILKIIFYNFFHIKYDNDISVIYYDIFIIHLSYFLLGQLSDRLQLRNKTEEQNSNIVTEIFECD